MGVLRKGRFPVTTPIQPAYWASWYDIVTDASLRQGDIFRNMIAFWLPQNLPKFDADPQEGEAIEANPIFARADWIILSASCDVDRSTPFHVLFARVIEASQTNLKAETAKVHKEKLEVLRQGYDPARFLLARNDDASPPFPQSFVEYRVQAFLPGEYVRRHCDEPRLRLKSPFREKFGNWAGASLSRVGIEDAIQIPRVAGFSASAVLRTSDDSL